MLTCASTLPAMMTQTRQTPGFFIFAASRRVLLPMLLLAAMFLAGETRALTFPLPEAGNSLVGKVQSVAARQEDTLLDIARRFNLGFNELVAANPGVDPWLPGEGTHIVVPTRFVLPPRPWRGIVINLVEMRLYYFPESEPGGREEVITYPVGIGREGWSTPLGEFSIKDKILHPSWTAPASIVAEMEAEGLTIQRFIPPGPDNPLGDFALMLSEPGYMLHGTNRPFSIGMRVSHGCIRLYPEDIEQLFARVPRKVTVRIENEPYKVGIEDGVLFLEAHAPLSEQKNRQGVSLTTVVSQVVRVADRPLPAAVWDRIIETANRHSGVPVAIVRQCAQPEAGEKRLLQIGAFKEYERAEHLAKRLEALAPSVSVQSCDSDGLCRVTVGPFTDCLGLSVTAQAIRDEFGLEGFVVAASQDAESAVARGFVNQNLGNQNLSPLSRHLRP
ncbi:ErfK/YbiS/YcfS/YnhG family protein [hydrothermal vent metagenome]|uniref:ErfK/YbiS/YcfS/YnhG family protein n=1 Tax=hydrothermal vent metagenome TaxID=652676 RepID=A0A3B1AHQ4_9ZZZZ